MSKNIDYSWSGFFLDLLISRVVPILFNYLFMVCLFRLDFYPCPPHNNDKKNNLKKHLSKSLELTKYDEIKQHLLDRLETWLIFVLRKMYIFILLLLYIFGFASTTWRVNFILPHFCLVAPVFSSQGALHTGTWFANACGGVFVWDGLAPSVAPQAALVGV